MTTSTAGPGSFDEVGARAEANRKSEAVYKEGPVRARDEEERPSPKPSAGVYALDDGTKEAVGEARKLLAYASSAGIPIELEVSDALARARAAQEADRWDVDVDARFWPAKSKLSQAVKPVTVASLDAEASNTAAVATRNYFRSTAILSAIILPISVVMFINTAISNEIGSLLKENDAAAVPLHEQLVNYQAATERPVGTAGSGQNSQTSGGILGLSVVSSLNLVEELAQFARVSRQLFSESQLLNRFIFGGVSEPPWASSAEYIRRENLELDVRAGQLSSDGQHPSLAELGFRKIATYQDIRAFAKQTQQINLVIYGAVTAYVLPIAYALLGACAFVLRSMAAQSGTKTYQPTYSNRARLVVALIAGTVVGLFNNFIQGVSVSPLAIAFLVGYAVEVFFSFLDGFVLSFERERLPKTLGAGARS